MAREFVFYGENGIEDVPFGENDAATAFGVAIDQLVEQVQAGTRDHRCDVRFGREVVAILAAAETARTESRTIPIPRPIPTAPMIMKLAARHAVADGVTS